MNRYIFKETGRRPPLVCSLADATVDDTICTIRNAIYDGADGFLIHLERLNSEAQNLDSLRAIYSYAEDRPVLSVNYRTQAHPEITDEELVKLQLLSVEAGAGCCDIMGDMFDKSPFELSVSPDAVQKQRELIGQIHAMGAQVMMSSHIWEPASPERLVSQALEMESRGADFVKLAIKISTEEELLEGIRVTSLLKKALKVPVLHIMIGLYGKPHRIFAPVFGSCMVLCVQRYTISGHKDKPLLRAAKAIYDNFDYIGSRN